MSFNNQRMRQRIFLALIRAGKFSAIVETGTYMGDTTLYMHEKSQCPVFTSELNSELYNGNKEKFSDCPDIHAYNEDSRSFLKRLIEQHGRERMFYYLDAHWNNDLPLAEELSILSSVPEAVIMVDDFQVPDDPGYGYDDYSKRKTKYVHRLLPYLRCGYEEYGNRKMLRAKLLRHLGVGRDDRGQWKALTLNIIPQDARDKYRVYFPAAPSSQETGAKRGCVVLVSAAMVPVVDSLKCLRRYRG